MTYKNMQVGDVVQRGEHEEDPYIIKAFEVDDHDEETVWLHRTVDGVVSAYRPMRASGAILSHLHPWAGALDLDIEAGDDLTPDWKVLEVRGDEHRMRLQNRHSQEPTDWMDVRLGRLAEKVWLIDAVTGWQQDYWMRQLQRGAVVKRRTKAVADFYPYGVVAGEPQRKGYWVEAPVMFGNETFPCLAEELDVVARSLTKFSEDLRKAKEWEELRLRERDEELASYKRTVGVVLGAAAAENDWGGVQNLYDALELEPPTARVEFNLIVQVRVIATRTGGDPGDEMKAAFLANSFSTGIVHGPGEGFGVWADADLKDVEIVAGSTKIAVADIEKEQ